MGLSGKSCRRLLTLLILIGKRRAVTSRLTLLDLDGNFPGGGGVLQDVPTAPGTLYYLSFAYAGNPDWPGTNPLKTMEFY